MKFVKANSKSDLTLQDVELQSGTCLSAEGDYVYVNAPVGNLCNSMGGFDVTYINTR